MAACPEEKSSSPKEPLKICSENTVNHERRKNCYNELSNLSKNHENFSEIGEKSNPDVNTLSEDEFLQLMIEASTFNKSSKQESALLKKLRIDNPITETEPSDKAKLQTNSQFPVHSKKTYNNSFHSRTLRKHSRNKDESSKGASNALQKGIHQSQSLQDLMSSDLSRSKQRSHKAHRTHSLSSDEVTGIDPDSLAILKKLGKKSKSKQSNANNKTNSSENGLANHCSVSGVAGSSRSGSPVVEIEMEEIKGEERSSNGVAQGNSKFYVDCNDIDSTVSFPLKMVSSMDDQNNEIVAGEQMKRFPIVPWPRPLQVQSFFSSVPMDDSFSGNDKQLLNADINGNPFTRNTRPSNLASFVSSTLMDYSGNNGLTSEAKNRKNKRLRNAVNKGVLSENIAGHRGEEDIDSLLSFINSSDKKAKSAVKGVMSGKGSLLHDNERKKSFGKDVKNCHKNVIGVKKDLKRSTSLENIGSNKMSDVFLFEPRGSASDLPDSKTVPSDNVTGRILDINSNEEEKCRESSTSESSLHSSPEVSSFAADFYSTADVSSQTIEESGFSVVKKKQRKKHQGKRSESYRWRNAQAQRKKGIMLPLAESKCGKQDARRKSTSSVPHSEHSSADNSDLDSVHSLPVRGSVPHPTQPHPHTTPSSSSSTPQASYADIARMPISKLHSPPIASQEAKKPDSAALPKRRVTTPEVRESPAVVLKEETPFIVPKEPADIPIVVPRESVETPLIVPKECVETPLTVPKESAETPFIETDSDSCDVKLRSRTKSTREINTQTEPELGEETKNQNEESKGQCGSCKNSCSCSKVALAVQEPSKGECGSCSLHSKQICSCSKVAPKSSGPVIMDEKLKTDTRKCEEPYKLDCGCCSSRKNTCSCSKVVPKSSDIPPVIMDNMPPESNACNVSFGFGIEEVLQMDTSFDLKQKAVSELPSVNSKTDSCSKSPSTEFSLKPPTQRQDLSREQSSHLQKVCYGTNRNLSYHETNVNVKKFNHSELTRFLGNEFYSIEKEIKGISKQKSRSKPKYYVDSSEEA